MRILIILVLAIAVYFGATYWVELQNPEVSKMTSDPLKKVAKKSKQEVASSFIGSFKIDPQASSEWLNSQSHLNPTSRSHFSKSHQHKVTFTYNGKEFYFGNDPELATNVEVVNETQDSLELKLLDSSIEHVGSLNFFLQTNGNGKVWYSNYSHMQSGKRQLYRACYTRQN